MTSTSSDAGVPGPVSAPAAAGSRAAAATSVGTAFHSRLKGRLPSCCCESVSGERAAAAPGYARSAVDAEEAEAQERRQLGAAGTEEEDAGDLREALQLRPRLVLERRARVAEGPPGGVEERAVPRGRAGV